MMEQHHRHQQAAASIDDDYEHEDATKDEIEVQEEDEDLLDFLVVSAIASACINNCEDDEEDARHTPLQSTYREQEAS